VPWVVAIFSPYVGPVAAARVPVTTGSTLCVS
jgi:hypothetical protein